MKTHNNALLAPTNASFPAVLFILLLWLPPQLIMGQPVYSGDVTFTTQSEINAWSSDYTAIEGSLTISGADITDLTPLQNIASVDGNLEISGNAILTSLTGLDAINSFGGSLYVLDNAALTSLTGLNGLTSAGELIIDNNPTLASLSGLNAITEIGGYFTINNNDNGS